MSNDFEQVKTALNLQQVITQETSLKMNGHHLKCFQCDNAGDVFTFLEEFLKIDKFEALKIAAQLSGVTLSSRDSHVTKLSTKERIFIEASKYYHTHFCNNGGRSYFIESRGHNLQVLKSMRVGWTDGGLVDHLRGKGFNDNDIRSSGLGKDHKHEDQSLLVDYFVKDVAIFPHFEKTRTLHFTIKDPAKKYKYHSEFPEGELLVWRQLQQNLIALHVCIPYAQWMAEHTPDEGICGRAV